METSKTVLLLFAIHNVYLMVSCEMVDMTFSFENNMVTWPTILKFNHTLAFKSHFRKAPFALSFNFQMSEHTGTHIDAPVHFAEGEITVDEIPPESLICEAIVVNITEQSSKDPDYQLSGDDLKDWENKYGKIPDGSVVFVLTGYGKYWGNYEKYMGVKEENASMNTTFHWPGFHKEAARWLVDNRKINGVGLDSRSLDSGNSFHFQAHRIFLGNRIYGLESVANIEKLPARGAIVYVMPMKIKGGSGGPVRIIAQTDPAGRSQSQHTANAVMMLSLSAAIITFMF